MKRLANYLIALALMAFTFTSCEDVPNPFGQILPPNGEEEAIEFEPAGSGTLAEPYNVQAIVNIVSALEAGVALEKEYYVKGFVTSIPNNGISSSYNNATFYISDDKEGNNRFYIYRAKGLGGGDITDEGFIKLGDEVVVCCSSWVNYQGNTPETSQGKAYIYSINGSSEGGNTPTPTPTEAKAVSVSEFLAAAESTSDWYQLTGTVKNLKDGDQYGNFDIEDASGSVYVYGLLSEKGGEKKKFQELVAAKGIKNGSKITIIGNRGAYNGTAQVTNAYFVSIEEGGGGGETPTPTEAKAVSVADFNAAAESDEVWYQLTGTVKNLKDGDQYGNFDLEDATGSVYVYGLLSEKGGEKKKFQELVAAKGVKNGSKITIIGLRSSYNGKIQVKNAYFVSIEEGGTSGGGSTGNTGADGSTIISVADFNAAAVSNDVWYQLTGTIKNLKDGDLYGNFDLEDSTGSVYVYGVLSEKGGEKKKFQDLVTGKGVANGKTITIVGTRGEYNGKIEVMNAYFIKVE